MANLIKNDTPYVGKMKLRFEKYPNYTGKDYLNKIHLDLGFVKLVSRITPKSGKDGNIVDPKKIKLIEQYTGGKIQDYNVDYDLDDFILKNSFMHPNGTYIGCIRDAWWYYKNTFIITNKLPHGVAMKLKDWGSSIIAANNLKDRVALMMKHNIEKENVEGFYGYTHRGGNLFKIGDKLFDCKWKPNWDEIKLEWIQDYCKACGYDIIPTTIENNN